MKYYLRILIIFTFFICNELFAQENVIVSVSPDNCIAPTPNSGTYITNSEINGKKAYYNGSFLRIIWDGAAWVIQGDNPNTGEVIWITGWTNTSNTTKPPDNCWTANSGCSIPYLSGDISIGGIRYYKDRDRDGYALTGSGWISCVPPWEDGWTTTPPLSEIPDCDDNNSSINPGTPEIYGNLVDENCDWEIQHQIVATAGPNGSISPSGTLIKNNNQNQEFTIVANGRYLIENVEVDGVSKGQICSWTFSSITSNHTISATFYEKWSTYDDDDDGLTLAQEDALGTSDQDKDSDDDGLLDGPSMGNVEGEDKGNDGVVDANETNPARSDSDFDGLNDGLERGKTTPIPSFISSSSGRKIGGTEPTWVGDSDPTTTTNPKDPDTDHDGLTDGVEDLNKNGRVDPGETDPNVNLEYLDSDNDNYLDKIELIAGTDPNDNDTDKDGILDGNEEVNHNGIREATETNPLDADTDDDGLSDGEDTSPLNADRDGDGLTDGLEMGRPEPGILGGTSNSGKAYIGTAASWFGDTDTGTKTDPNDNDTDNDGITDGNEDANKNGRVDPGETDPNNPSNALNFNKMSFQGYLTDLNGNALSDGSYNLIFKLYNTISGIELPLWEETQSVPLLKGVFSVILGSNNPITLPFNTSYYLGVTIQGQDELSPRLPLVGPVYLNGGFGR